MEEGHVEIEGICKSALLRLIFFIKWENLMNFRLLAF